MKILFSLLFTVNIAVAAYVPPIGIPVPPFGINELASMYVGNTFDFGAGLVTYPVSASGPYTHYVNNAHGSATDTANAFGTPSVPRLTIPDNLTAGMVVEIHGPGTYVWNLGSTTSVSAANGTVTDPIFIRGIGSPTVTCNANERLYLTDHLIIEDIAFDFTTGTGSFDIFHNSEYIGIRRCTFKNGNRDRGRAIINISQGSGFVVGRYIRHIVFHDCEIGPNGLTSGVIDNTFESGIQGITISNAVDHVWVLNSYLHENAEDSIHVAVPSSNGNVPASHIYVGGNEFYHDGENAIDIKNGTHVVFSKNIVHGYRVLMDPMSGGSDGTAVVINDEGANDEVWVIFNYIYDSVKGVRWQNSTAATQSVYVIGNVIENMVLDTAITTNNAVEGRCVDASSGIECWVVGNTFSGYQDGIYLNNNETNYIWNNIFNGLRDTALGWDVYVNNQVGYTVDFRNALSWPIAGRYNKVNYTWTSTTTGNPGFTNEGASDFTLTAASPAIGAGYNASTIYDLFETTFGVSMDYDRAGTARPNDGSWDIGAYEGVSYNSTNRQKTRSGRVRALLP